MSASPDDPPASPRRFSAAAERNRAPILDVLMRMLPARGRALEIASGTGQHVAWFARRMPGWTWQPTDFSAASLPSILAWCDGSEGGDVEPLANVEPPLRLDVLAPAWPLPAAARFDAILCANLLHIAPWACCGALMRGAARHLGADGVLVTYGPYLEDGVPAAPGNLAFDADLRGRDPAWGIRRVDEVAAEARTAGLRLRERVAMPANNLTLVWARAEAGA